MTHENEHRLYRSQSNRVLAGVAGGLAEYFGWDPTLVRLGFVLTALFSGVGLLVYIAALVAVPTNPHQSAPIENGGNMQGSMVLGVVLVAIGLIWLAHQMGFYISFNFLRHIPWSLFWAVVLIGIGGTLLYDQFRRQNAGEDFADPAAQPLEGGEESTSTRSAKAFGDFRRSATDRKFLGVCGGLANYFNIDPNLIRLACLLAIFLSGGAVLLIYLVMGFIFPEESGETI